MILKHSPVVTNPTDRTSEPFDWKILEKWKASISEYGLKSQIAQSLLQNIFTSNTFIPANVQTLVRQTMPPNQQIQFHRSWEAKYIQEAAKPRVQGDPLYGLTAQ